LFLGVACFSFLNLKIKKDRHNLTIKEEKDLNFVILLKGNPKNYLRQVLFHIVSEVVGIPMGTNCAPPLADFFLCSFESEFLQKFVKDKTSYEARDFIFTYRYIDDVLSINNSKFAEFLPLIYPPELGLYTYEF
jgi:hypothetical protein